MTKKKLSLYEKIVHHRRMAESYFNAYSKKVVKDGATYDEWKFADDAVYWSPYFGNHIIKLKDHPISVQKSAHMEALSYSMVFPDWGPVDFKCWPSDRGFVMKTHFVGHMADGKEMGFFAYGFIETNDYGEIIRWETHVNEDYSAFLDVAIGVRGPFLENANDYMEAVAKALQRAGVEMSLY
ncbi:MAG: hypothetical protein JW801_13460 [Bacteroidales bacterium]|nr:hypothetical protein [Bacteroidales bacterium]